jgi:hypothetical protein
MDIPTRRGARFDLIVTVIGAFFFVLAIASIVGVQLEDSRTIANAPIPELLGTIVRIPAALFLIAGVTGLHNAQKHQAGGLGRVAYWAVVVSLILFAVALSPYWAIGWLLLHVGAILFGTAVLRTGGFPKGAGWLLVLGPPLGFLAGAFADAMISGTAGWGAFVGSVAIVAGFVWLAGSEFRVTREVP